MLGNHDRDLYRSLSKRDALNDPDLHNTRPRRDENSDRNEDESPDNAGTSTAVPSTEDAATPAEGVWGEREIGGPVSHKAAMEDFETMRRELTRLSNARSASQRRRSVSRGTAGRSLRRRSTAKTQKSGRLGFMGRKKTRASTAADDEPDGEMTDDEEAIDDAGDNDTLPPTGADFELGPFIREGHFDKRTEAGESAKKVGVVFRNLTVKGVGSTLIQAKTLPQAIMGTFGPDLYHLICRFIPALNFQHPPLRTLISDFSGVVRDGEMMLVLGRPGSGCSTFLKAIANKRAEFAALEGDVSYGGITAKEQHKAYRGEVVYNPEDDQHLPTLNVWQTLKFSLMNKTRGSARAELPIIIDALMKMFGISHTAQTLVGNELVRGISGGERKRVSIAETLAAKSTVVCWDNSTRGLDASTALDYANSLRIMTDVSNRTTLVTLYQAGEQIYELMDKVMVIDEGRLIYQGPANEAKQYFVDLGLFCPDHETTADFLTSVTDPHERKYRDGCEASSPKTAEDFERAFRQAQAYQRVLADMTSYEDELRKTDYSAAREFRQSVREQKSKHVAKSSSFTVPYHRQILSCAAREFWLVWGDKSTIYTKFFIIISQSLIVASLFYGQSDETSAAFSRGGLAFFSILFLGWLQLSELIKAVSGRAVIQRHKEYAFYRPSAVVLARVLADAPLILCMTVPFSIVVYFLGSLDVNVSKFFIFFITVYVSTFCLTAMYRMFASLSPSINDAVRFSGTAFNLLIIFTGYAIPRTQLVQQKIWFGWLYYVNPLSYAFEISISNEFYKREMPCAEEQLVPQGPGIRPENQGCAISGARAGNPTVSGADYIYDSFGYTHSHLWRNFCVVIAFTVLYIVVTIVASETFAFVQGGGGALIFKRGSKLLKTKYSQQSPTADAEKAGQAGIAAPATSNTSSESNGEKQADGTDVAKTKSKVQCQSEGVFTWENVNFSVPYGDGERQLLKNVHGYARPGVMVALMGASGAGKTTLLNTLSQRQRMGKVSGTFLEDGRPLGPVFQRSTGFVEQMDLHDQTATIKEAFQFSAILRQDRNLSRDEKLAYVDEIIDLLELGEIEDALIMSLSVEQRKRVTIGVELAAKPALLFLDEPTSGLDSQSAYSIVRFLQKLARAGHGIICTIHQPSSLLIQQFDEILALNPGGQTFYYGPVGNDGQAVIKYFADRGVVCPPGKNVAEFILETAAKVGQRADGTRLNWNKEWAKSVEKAKLLQTIHDVNDERVQLPVPERSTLHEYSSPVGLQCYELTRRMFTQHWRDPGYLYGKLYVAVILGIFNGFTFYNLKLNVSDMQDRMFSVFLILLIPPTVVNAVIPKFFQNMSLWLFRENPSRIYGWFAFCTASVVTEIPISIISGTIYWLLWYWPTGLPRDSATAGYVYWMTILFFLFQASWGQWICAFVPSFTALGSLLPLFFVMFSLFNGVIRPYAQMPVLWKYTIYYISPSTYYVGGSLAAVLHSDIPVQCSSTETARFNPPSGQTCEQFAGAFVRERGYGYLVNPSDTTDCQFCQYSNASNYLVTLNITPDKKWKYLPVFLAFCVSNWALVYFFIYTVRVRGWKFGFGYLFDFLNKVVAIVKAPFKKGWGMAKARRTVRKDIGQTAAAGNSLTAAEAVSGAGAGELPREASTGEAELKT